MSSTADGTKGIDARGRFLRKTGLKRGHAGRTCKGTVRRERMMMTQKDREKRLTLARNSGRSNKNLA